MNLQDLVITSFLGMLITAFDVAGPAGLWS